MKSFFIFFLLFVVAHCKKCFPVEDKPKCPKGEVYQLKGPGPFCYPTCCGPRGPPCRMDSFTTGCFCADSDQIKMFPVANNTVADPNNPCVSTCDFTKCEASKCPKANEEWRDCGPTSMCDNQVCRVVNFSIFIDTTSKEEKTGGEGMSIIKTYKNYVY
ncbi:hypothetical protein ACKWTF_003554 [Chironomus riparius]